MLTQEAQKLEIAALHNRIQMLQESRSFWRWGAIVMGTSLIIAIAVAVKLGCW